MTKDNVLDWDRSASGNTDIRGISILGTAVPSNFDDAEREMMAQIRTGIDSGYFNGSVYVTKASGYTAIGTDRGKTINCTTDLTLALTAAATLGAGWIFHVKANGGDVTIDPDASETINGAATYVIYDGNSATVICDGTNFQLVHSGPITTKWVQYTPTWVGFGTVVAGHIVRSRRVGGSLETQFQFTTGASTNVTASMTIGFNGTNGGITIDAAATNGIRLLAGPMSINSAFAASHYILGTGSNGLVEFGIQTGSVGGLNPTTGLGGFGTAVVLSGSFSLPITGW